MTGTSEFAIWQTMKQRCWNPNDKRFQDYGGRGIRICARWALSFESFYADMGPRPEGLSIDRIDNDGHYEPANCRWATRKEQARNSRKTHWITLNHETKPLGEWARQTGIPRQTILSRLNKLGWDVKRALSPANG